MYIEKYISIHWCHLVWWAPFWTCASLHLRHCWLVERPRMRGQDWGRCPLVCGVAALFRVWSTKLSCTVYTCFNMASWPCIWCVFICRSIPQMPTSSILHLKPTYTRVSMVFGRNMLLKVRGIMTAKRSKSEGLSTRPHKIVHVSTPKCKPEWTPSLSTLHEQMTIHNLEAMRGNTPMQRSRWSLGCGPITIKINKG